MGICQASRARASLTPIALTGNILILRGDIVVLPPERKSVSYEFLSQLVGEYLLTACPDVDISAALSIMPYTRSTFLEASPYNVAID